MSSAETRAYLKYRHGKARPSLGVNDVIGAVVGGVVGLAGPDETWSFWARVALAAMGAMAGVAITEILAYVIRFVWVAPREIYKEDQQRIRAIEAARDSALHKVAEIQAQLEGRVGPVTDWNAVDAANRWSQFAFLRLWSPSSVVEIANLYRRKDLTKAQADVIAEQYLWMWARFESVVKNVETGTKNAIVLFEFNRGTSYTQLPISVMAIFDRNLNPWIEMLRKGEQISVVGQIRATSSSFLVCYPCEREWE